MGVDELLQQTMAVGVSACCMTSVMAMVFACSWIFKHNNMKRQKKSIHRRMLPTCRPGVAHVQKKLVTQEVCSVVPQLNMCTALACVGGGGWLATVFLTCSGLFVATLLWLIALPAIVACKGIARLLQRLAVGSWDCVPEHEECDILRLLPWICVACLWWSGPSSPRGYPRDS